MASNALSAAWCLLHGVFSTLSAARGQQCVVRFTHDVCCMVTAAP
jgi:hypothetical protein